MHQQLSAVIKHWHRGLKSSWGGKMQFSNRHCKFPTKFQQFPTFQCMRLMMLKILILYRNIPKLRFSAQDFAFLDDNFQMTKDFQTIFQQPNI